VLHTNGRPRPNKKEEIAMIARYYGCIPNEKEEFRMSAQYYGCISIRETDYARPEVRALFDGQFPDEYFEPTVKDGIVTFEDADAFYGSFSELESALDGLGIAYDRKSAAYEGVPEILFQNRPNNNDWKGYHMLGGKYALTVSYIRDMRGRMTAEEFYAWADSLSEPSPLQRD